MTALAPDSPEILKRHKILLDVVYGIAYNEKSWQDLASALHNVHRNACFALVSSKARNQVHLVQQVTAGYDSTAIESYQSYYRLINPWATLHVAAGGPAVVYTTRDAAAAKTQAELLQSEFYADWVRPNNDIREGVGISLGQFNGCTLACSANVPHKAADECIEALRIDFTALARPMAMAMQAAHLTERVSREHSLIEAILHECHSAAFLIDCNASVIEMNGAARRLATRGDGVTVNRQSLLAFAEPNSDDELRLQLHNARLGRYPGDAFVVTRQEGGPLTACLLPALGAAEQGEPIARRLLLLFLLDPWSKEIGVPEHRISRGLGLSRSEARIALGIANGRSTEELARSLKLSRNTVRNHIAAILQKTGCSKQSDIVRLVYELRL